jgi:hypothetical protein
VVLIARGGKTSTPGPGPGPGPYPPITPDEQSGVVHAEHKALVDDRGPFNVVAVSFFWLLWGLKFDRERTIRNLDYCLGADVLRIFCCVGQPGDSWQDRIIDPNWPDFQDVLADALYEMKVRGMRALVTIFADVTQNVPNESSRTAHVDRVLQVLLQHPECVCNVAISNEGIGFDGTSEINRHVARVQQQSAFLCSGLCSVEEPPATVFAARTERKTTGDGGMWEHTEQPYDLKDTHLVASDEEPIGPQSSVAEDDDPLRNTAHAVCAWVCRAPIYCYHCGAGIRGGGQADLDRGRHANFFDQPSFAPTLQMLRAARDFLPGDLAQWSNVCHSNPRYEGIYPFATGPLQPFDPSGWFLKSYANLENRAAGRRLEQRRAGGRYATRAASGRFVCWFTKIEKDIPLQAYAPMTFDVYDMRGTLSSVALQAGETYTLTVRGAVIIRGAFV